MNGKKSIMWMLLCILATDLYGQGNIPQEVDPSSGKMNLSITLTTMTGRGFDLPIVFNYNSNLWNMDFNKGTKETPLTWLAKTTPYGLGWQCNTGGRTFVIEQNDTTYEYRWTFVDNNGSAHPFAKYGQSYSNYWITTDNSWIRVAEDFDSAYNGTTKPIMPDGLCYDSATSYRDEYADSKESDDGVSGIRYGYITDANGNRPFHFRYEFVGVVRVLTKIEGIKDTAFFSYDATDISYPRLSSVRVRSGNDFNMLYSFYSRTDTVSNPPSMGSKSESVLLVDSITMNGNILYKFSYDSCGEIASVTNKTGGKKEFFYGTHPYWEVNIDNQPYKCYTRRVDSVKVTPRSNESYTWRYQVEIDSLYKNPNTVRVITPSLSKIEYNLHSYDCRPAECDCNTSLSRDGLVYQVSTYKDTATGTPFNTFKNGWNSNSSGAAPRWNLHIDTSVTIWEATEGYSSDDKIDSTIVTSEDDYNNPLYVKNATHMGEYSRTINSKYVYEDNVSYKNRNILGLLKEEYAAYIDDGGQYFGKTRYYYDTQELTTYGSITGWVDPNNNYRANITKIVSKGAYGSSYNFLGPGGDSSIAEFRYDQCGNELMSIVYPSMSTPETTFTRYTTPYVFPARTVNYVTSTVDSLSSSTVYNFHTGLPDSTSDFNGQWTRFTYDDFGRVLTVKLPGEAQPGTRHHYYDITTVPYQIDSTKLDASRWLVSYSYTDGFGSVIQTQSVNGADSKTLVTDFKSRVDTGYTMASNTYEVAAALSSYNTPNWGALKYTKTYFDALGRDTLSVDPTGNKTWSKYGINGTAGRSWSEVKIQNDSINYWQSWTRTENDLAGRPVRIINNGKRNGSVKADTSTFSYCWGGAGSLVQESTNPQGQNTFYYYNRSGSQLGLDGPDVASDTFFVDAGNDTNYVDVLFNHDNLGRVLEKTTPKGTIKNTYDEIGRLKYVSTREKGSSSYGTSLEMVYDSTAYGKGKLVMSKMPGVRGIAYEYDILGRTTMKATALRYSQGWKTVRYGYNDAGLLTKLIYPKPDTAHVADTVKYFYDNFGRIDSVPRFLNNVRYGTNGLIDSIYYANGVKTGFTYNDRLDMTYLKTHMGATNLISQGYSYEPGGLVHSIADDVSGFSGYSMTYKYDHLGRLAKFASTAVTDSFEYDKAGNRTLRRSGGTNYTYNYTSGTNRLASISNEGFSFNYDSCGNIIQQMLASDTMFFGYDIYGRLTQYKNHGGSSPGNPAPGDTIVEYEYGGAGDLRCRKTVIRGTGQLESTGPFLKLEDAFNDLVLSIDLNDAKRDIGDVYIRNSTDTFYIAIFPRVVDNAQMSNSRFAIAIDNDRQYNSGNARLPMDTMTILSSYSCWEYCLYINGPTSYGYYDTSGTQHSLPIGMSFSAINKSQVGDVGNDTGYIMKVLKSTIPLDSIVGLTVFSFKPGYSNTDESDNGGSSATDVVPGDASALETGVVADDGRAYDPDSGDPDPGHGCTVRIEDRIYIYDGLTPLVEYSTVYAGEYSNALVRYVYGIPGATIRIETKPNGTGRDTVFLHTDGLGSVRSITNVSGTQLSHYRYDAFGKLIESASDTTGNTRRFCGKDWDVEESLIYMAARYYDPRFGRFTSRDPEQTTMSPYSYCANNPISLVDPTGHRSGCAGGGYSINYARQNYTFLMSVRAHPGPLEHRSAAPELIIYGYGNPDFVDASGGYPFRNWWDDYRDYFSEVEIRDIIEARVRMAALRSAIRALKANFTDDLYKYIPTGEVTANDAKKTTVKLEKLTPEQKKEFFDLLKAIEKYGMDISGSINIPGGHTTISITDLLSTATSWTGNFLVASIPSSEIASGYSERACMAGAEGLSATVLALDFSNVGNYFSLQDQFITSFFHEMLHLNSSIYDNEYHGGLNPINYTSLWKASFFEHVGYNWWE